MIYVDTSIIVAALAKEPLGPGLQVWMGQQPSGRLCISEWVSVEFASALAIKTRRGEYSQDTRVGVLDQWRALRATNLDLIGIPGRAFGLAADLVNDPASVLRAGDALHLAIASLGGHSLATLDSRLAEAAARADVTVEAVA